jgi:hypothetical protein
MVNFIWKADRTSQISPKDLPYIDSCGKWLCKKCKKKADTEHNKKECHACQDWNGCGKDCTLSKLICKTCNISEDV